MEHSKVIRKKDLTILEKMYIPEIVKGMRLTIAQMFRPKFTIQYPEHKFAPSASFRGRPVLVEENGTRTMRRVRVVQPCLPFACYRSASSRNKGREGTVPGKI